MTKAKYQKLQIPTQVTFATKTGTLSTLEGSVNYQVGDALMTGILGEQWPIARDHFNLTYEPMPLLNMGEDGAYIKKSIIIEAEQMLAPFEIYCINKQAILKGKAKDWMITSPDGNQWVVANNVFKKTYKLINNH